MISRSRAHGGSSAGLSLNRPEKSRAMLSPQRSTNNRTSPQSVSRQGDSSKRVTNSKSNSITSKPIDKKSPSLTTFKGSTAQISLTQGTSSEQKKITNSIQQEPQQCIDNSSFPLQQLDISGITPADIKNDFSGLNNVNPGKISPQVNTSIINPINTSTVNPIMTSQVLKKAVSVVPQNLNVASLSQRSPSKIKRAETMNISANLGLIQSANFGNVYNANQDPNQSIQYNATGGSNFNNLGMDSSVNFEVLKQFDQKQKSANVKTFIRIRPLNKMEIEFNENGCGNESARCQDAKTICIMPEKMPFVFDKVYPTDSIQETIYEDVGKELVNDVLMGYNGTIFAYGPTGSGKTYTMFGNVNDQNQKGIIPRVSNQLFTHINSIEQDVEFIITCSMLEIYKENLFDLLKVDRVGLKIKENPQKGGIYVQGLTTISVDCEEEILDAINLGYQSKQTRETRMNEYSSRSHTIFTINVTQRYPNGQEKLGKLNLVDLAGSEKVGKSGAVGESLEEAKKINLSLSCLGNVIHALTSGADHIPYRDSKLTRILQESLGGNYKTTLIATISPHSSQHEEQISTLRFAARAKTIKNQVKMNVKLSVEQMRKLIEQLKTELEKAKTQNTRFRGIIKKLKDELRANQMSILQSSKEGKVTEQQQQAMQNMRALEDILNVSDLDLESEDAQNDTSNKQETGGKSNNSKIDYEDMDSEDAINNNLLAQEGLLDLKNNGMSQFSGKRGGPQSKILPGQLGKPANLDYRVAYIEKSAQCRALEKEIMELKKERLEAERNLGDVREEKHKLEFNHTQQITKNDYNRFEIEIMQKQIQSLVDSICKSENTIGTLMKEKQEISQKKIDEFLDEKMHFSEIHFSEYFKKSINFNYDNLVQKWSDVQKNMKAIGIDDQQLFQPATEVEDDRLKSRPTQTANLKNSNNLNTNTSQKVIEDQNRGSFIGNLDFNSLSNPYEILEEIVEFPGQLDKVNQKHPISRDLMIILLKKQLFNSHIINQHLARTINALEWKQIIEYGKAKMKSVLNKIQSKHINNLEQVISEASQNYRNLRNRIEQVELETQFVKEKIDSQQDDAPKKNKIVKDTESIRHLLMKPSNEGIRSSLRGSYIGFQLDDKQLDSPMMKELKEADDLLQKELLPLTYDKAIEDLKQRNALIKKAYQEFKGGFLNGLNQDFIEQILKEKERLEGKLTIIQDELKMESGKSEHYADAYKAEKQNFAMQKEQTKELEQFLVTKMKEESEQVEKTQKKISDQHEKEILKYQQSFQRISDMFSDYIRNSLGRLQDLKKITPQAQPQKIDQMISEMFKIKDQYYKLFGEGNGQQNENESPSMQSLPGGGMKFNPTSMIFGSFDQGQDFAIGQVGNKNDEDVSIKKKIDSSRTSLMMNDEINEGTPLNSQITQNNQFIQSPHFNNLSDLNINSDRKMNNTQKSPQSYQQQGLLSASVPIGIQANNIQVNSINANKTNKYTTNHGVVPSIPVGQMQNNFNGGQYQVNQTNAVQNANKPKIYSSPPQQSPAPLSSGSSKSQGAQSLFGYRKY